jgi:hypothetical protein
MSMPMVVSDIRTIHFIDFANLGHVDKLVDQSLTVNLGKDATLVVIPEKNSRI